MAALASEVPVSDGFLLLVMLSVLLLPVSLVASCVRLPAAIGAVASTVKVSPLAVVLLPATSVALMVGV